MKNKRNPAPHPGPTDKAALLAPAAPRPEEDMFHLSYVGEPDVAIMYKDIQRIRDELEQMPVTRTVTGYANLLRNASVQHVEGPSAVIIHLHSRLVARGDWDGILLLDEGPIPPDSIAGWTISFQIARHPPISVLRDRRKLEHDPS